MIVKAIFKNETHNYFRDIETKEKRVFGDIFECSEELAEERIKKGLVKKATAKEIKDYESSKKEFVVLQEDDGKVHVRPLENGEVIDTSVEEIIPTDEIMPNEAAPNEELVENKE